MLPPIANAVYIEVHTFLVCVDVVCPLCSWFLLVSVYFLSVLGRDGMTHVRRYVRIVVCRTCSLVASALKG